MGTKKQNSLIYLLKEEKDVVFMWIALIVICISMVLGVIFLIRYLYEKLVVLGATMKTWDVVLVAVLLTGIFSLFLTIFSKWLEGKCHKRALFYSKRVEIYEEIVSFIFKYQKRQGYTPLASSEEAQQACFMINQKVMLWASIKVQRHWDKYLSESWNQDNDTYQLNIISLFYRITKETGQRLTRDSFYDCPPLRLLYDIPEYILTVPNSNQNKKHGK